MNETAWQWDVGTWFITFDRFAASAMPEEFCKEYDTEKIGVCRLQADERLRLILDWLEAAQLRFVG
jgi:hypothetical protein